jgi:PAS domain S-box-containing protein
MDPFDIRSKSPTELIDLLKSYQQAININVICSVTDRRGTIVYANEKFCEVSQYSKNELVGQNHRIINSDFHPKELFQQMWETISSGHPWAGELRNKAKDGSFYWVDTVILPIHNVEGKIIQFLSLRTLITEKKLAEAERKEYTNKLKEMLHMTSHRVRAPLARCIGIMNLVEHGELLNEDELQEVMKHLKSNALELDDFTKELTVFMSELERKYTTKN